MRAVDRNSAPDRLASRLGVVMQITVEDRRDDNRYEVTVDGKPAGLLTYRLRPGRIAFTHAEVDRAFSGHGVGSKLASYALDDARRRGLTVLPDCPFVSGYIAKHMEYVDLVPAESRTGYGLG